MSLPIRSMCCDAEIEEMDGGFWFQCSACLQSVPTRDRGYPFNDNCPGSFSNRYDETDNIYLVKCRHCGQDVRASVGFIRYGRNYGMQPHKLPIP